MLMNQIIADVGYYETRAAVLEDNRLVELHFERRKQSSLVNNIYRGKIVNLVHGLQMIFVDIGYDKNVFVYKDQLSVPYETLNLGDHLLIQITKDAMDDKGPKATMHLSLPGKYVVMLPQTQHVGISKKIDNPEERKRLQELAESLSGLAHGIIFRTESANKSCEVLQKDWCYLMSLWAHIVEKQQQSPIGTPLYREHALLPRLLRDVANRETTSFLINDAYEAETLRQICKQTMPGQVQMIRELENSCNPFIEYQVEAQWQRAMNTTIFLGSGGSLVIHHTEALTTIDVNTGRFLGHKTFQESALDINMEAAEEIARQIRLRDIGGIIIIDFIDMKKPESQQRVVMALEEALKADRQKNLVLGMTQLGLVEMTRKRTRKKVSTLFNSTCRCCSGSGTIRSIYWTMYEIESSLRRIETQEDIKLVLIQLHPHRWQEFVEADIDLKSLAGKYNLSLEIQKDSLIPVDEHKLIGFKDETSLEKMLKNTSQKTSQDRQVHGLTE